MKKSDKFYFNPKLIKHNFRNNSLEFLKYLDSNNLLKTKESFKDKIKLSQRLIVHAENKLITIRKTVTSRQNIINKSRLYKEKYVKNNNFIIKNINKRNNSIELLINNNKKINKFNNNVNNLIPNNIIKKLKIVKHNKKYLSQKINKLFENFCNKYSNNKIIKSRSYNYMHNKPFMFLFNDYVYKKAINYHINNNFYYSIPFKIPFFILKQMPNSSINIKEEIKLVNNLLLLISEKQENNNNTKNYIYKSCTTKVKKSNVILKHKIYKRSNNFATSNNKKYLKNIPSKISLDSDMKKNNHKKNTVKNIYSLTNSLLKSNNKNILNRVIIDKNKLFIMPKKIIKNSLINKNIKLIFNKLFINYNINNKLL